MPTFHFAVVVDDHLMGMTHVIRGQEHLQNCWKHIALQKALGFPSPNYAHIPLIMNPNGTKMSKRQSVGQVNTLDFAKDGYLPSVMLNYLALLGWNPGNNVEEFNLDFMIEHFRLEDVGKANARFDYNKLARFNANAIQKMHYDDFYNELTEYATTYYRDKLSKILDFVNWDDYCTTYQPRSKTLKEPMEIADYVTKRNLEYTEANIKKAFGDKDYIGITLLTKFRDIVTNLEFGDASKLNICLETLAADHHVKVNRIGQPLRLALTGTLTSPPIQEVMMLLKKKLSLERINALINAYEQIMATTT
jgi:glutamyl/glutaminyl-tRNA synthetase